MIRGFRGFALYLRSDRADDGHMLRHATATIVTGMLVVLVGCVAPSDDGVERAGTDAVGGIKRPPLSPTPTTSTPPGSPTTVAAGAWWRPGKGTTWQWQLDGTIDTGVDVSVYDVDLFDTPASTVATLHAQGRKAICYFTVGSWETYRPDVASMPESVKGGVVDGWPQERWLDIRRIDLIGPYMESRLDLCKSKGFDGVEGDWMDNHLQDTGFPITYADSLAYNRWLIAEAHERGLAMGVKNAIDMAPVLAAEADYEINEQCAEFDECDTLSPWIAAGKPVFHTEYYVTPSEFCPVTVPLGFSSLYKRLELDAWSQTC